MPFPAWCLPNGVISASDSVLEKSIESCERWEWFGGGLVVVGVIAEVAIAAIHPPYDSFLEQWGSSLANSLVAIGVALEIKFGQMAGLRQGELNRRSDEKVSSATDRAANAEMALLKFRQSRRSLMTGEVKTALREKLLHFAGTEFDTAYGSGGEQMHFLWDLEEVLHSANWRQLPWTINAVGNTLSRFRSQRPLCGVIDAENVELQIQPEWRPKNEKAAQALIAALASVGITGC
jgi:hypothetical protein